MQIDIGFGDVMTPGLETSIYPIIRDFPAPMFSDLTGRDRMRLQNEDEFIQEAKRSLR